MATGEFKMETQHWGELPPRPEEIPPPLDAAGRAQLLKAKPMKITPLAANPFHNQSSGSGSSSTAAGGSQSSNKQQTSGADTHQISSVYYPDLLYIVKLQRLWAKLINPSTPSTAEYILPRRPAPLKSQKASGPAAAASALLPHNLSTKCLDLPRDELLRQTRQAVVLTAHQLGYDDSKESAIDLMVDITGQYLQKLTQTLRQAVDTADLRANQPDDQDFVDALDRTFHECRVPSIPQLHRFWLMERRFESKLLEKIQARLKASGVSTFTTSGGTADDFSTGQNVNQLTELEFFDKSPADTLMEDYPEFVIDINKF